MLAQYRQVGSTDNKSSHHHSGGGDIEETTDHGRPYDEATSPVGQEWLLLWMLDARC